jgi:hypothetical protein
MCSFAFPISLPGFEMLHKWEIECEMLMIPVTVMQFTRTAGVVAWSGCCVIVKIVFEQDTSASSINQSQLLAFRETT